MAGRMPTLAVAVSLLAACGPAAAAPRYSAPPKTYLLTIDQLVSPGFIVQTPPSEQDASVVAHGDAAVALRLAHNGLAAAATVSYARTVDFPTSNGPVEVTDTVERFASADGATASFTADVDARDATHGEVPTSAGVLGDQAHADSLVMTAPDGIDAVQVTLEWRVANVVVVLVLRGRYGGTRLEDALLLAHRQTSTQLSQESR